MTCKVCTSKFTNGYAGCCSQECARVAHQADAVDRLQQSFQFLVDNMAGSLSNMADILLRMPNR